MLFSSITFLYYFLPIVLVLYLVAPFRFRNAILFISSMIFYAWGEPKYIFLMLISILIGYLAGILMDKLSKKIVLFSSIGLCLSLLVYFKYTNFFISNINSILKTNLPWLTVIMPIGISFYTFQIISYIIDVYRENVPTQKNFLYLATYISMFPQLIAGPIVRYSDINKQLHERKITIDNIYYGICRFILGLGKKVLIANQLGELIQIFRYSNEKTIAFYWVYAISVSLQIYFDFSGYSDMAIGLGKLFGFSFLENFNYPFISKSVTEFWRRWHMSLGTWFRDYIYIPLGGNRNGIARQLLNIFIVWMLTGFWHGAEWNFIIWGLLFAILLIIEKLWLYKHLEKAKVWNRIYMFFIVTISFVIFQSGNALEMINDIRHLFIIDHNITPNIVGQECLYYLKSFAPVLIAAVIGSTSLPKYCYSKIKENAKISNILIFIELFVLLFLLLLITAYLIDGSFNPFLYFRF